MSGATYEWCPICDTKALYCGETDVPDGVVVLHRACLAVPVGEVTSAYEAMIRSPRNTGSGAERDRLRDAVTALASLTGDGS